MAQSWVAIHTSLVSLFQGSIDHYIFFVIYDLSAAYRWKQEILGGGGDTAIYGLYRYLLLWRVWFSGGLVWNRQGYKSRKFYWVKMNPTRRAKHSSWSRKYRSLLLWVAEDNARPFQAIRLKQLISLVQPQQCPQAGSEINFLIWAPTADQV